MNSLELKKLLIHIVGLSVYASTVQDNDKAFCNDLFKKQQEIFIQKAVDFMESIPEKKNGSFNLVWMENINEF